MFSDKIALQIAAAARSAGISETGMLAIVEVETGGSPLEADGHTPNFLFERHIFHRELAARQPGKLKAAVAAGLAIPRWNKATQYRDERTSAERLALLARAKAVDEDCTLRSCSWGLPQIMGNECHEVGFATAAEMVQHLTDYGIPAHIELMIRFLKSRKLESAIERGDWAYVALRYNGAGYRQNQYDTRLAAANRKWQRRLPQIEATGAQEWPEQHLSRDEIQQIQIKLRSLNYHEVGRADGTWGTKTTGALSAFQAHEGLPVNGHYDDATRDALGKATSRPIDQERVDATIDDLRNAGSKTIEHADKADVLGKAKIIVGGAIATGAGGESINNTLNSAQDAIDKANQVKSILTQAHDLIAPLLTPEMLIFGVVLVVVGFLVVRYAGSIKAARLADHQSGVHAGTV